MSRKQKHHSNPKAEIDIVITTGGRFDMLAKCLDALYREAKDVPLSIYIIDNASPAEERLQNDELFFEREDSSVCEFKAKRLQQSLGFSASNNEGARMGSAPLIMFLNDDVELHEGTVRKVIDDFKTDNIGIVGIKLLFPPVSTSSIRPPNKVQHVGMAMNIRGEPIHPLLGWSPDHPKTKISRDVICVTGACLTIRRSLFNKVNGWSPEYGAGTWEDVDLCFKARREGFRTWVNCDAIGYHYTNATVEKNRVGFPIQQNRLIFQAKWAESGLMAWTHADFL